MKALIFAAGLGERMRPLTDRTPKPLLEAGGKPLIAWHLEKLAAAGVSEVVINTSWLAEQFPQVLGDGLHWGMRLHYSYEGRTPLETGGGMFHALSLLGTSPFIAVNGDIWTDFDLSRLPSEPTGDTHLVLVENPVHHSHGDFALDARGLLHATGESRLTFSGIGVYRSALFDNWRTVIGNTSGADDNPPRFKLAPLLRHAMLQGRATGEHHLGRWTDVGTPERLAQLNNELAGQSAAPT
ncbi:N-acetylmuramate alpha-1-phosphate uridylyltransferase MurU [Pseudoxanthomonas sp. UTMC 1351]|uniref:N-acetylmuramate alpha-1-phosphate uridylyltransferase MurU n=1 Tax=Pseudoxanthomonas sp. UTMC 1351 TaxID=2695853 RepID=UPI0034CED57F